MANKIYAVSMGDSYVSGGDPSSKNTVLYAKWDPPTDTLDKDFTRVFAESWEGTDEQRRWMEKAAASGRSIPSLYLPKTGKVYFLHEDQYVRCTLATMTVDEGFPKSIGSYWPGLRAVGFDSGIDSILWWDEKTVYIFKGLHYVRYNLETDKVDEGYPKSIVAYWPGFKEAGFEGGIDAIFRWEPDWVYAFKNDQYIRLHIPTNKVDVGPRTSTRYWNPLGELSSRRVLTVFQAPDVTAPVRVSLPTPQLNNGFPTGTFKITNAETGLCLEAYLHTQGAMKAGTHAVENPSAGRSDQAVFLEKCTNNKNQLWRYNPKTKTLESVGASGRCLVMDPVFGQAAGEDDSGEHRGTFKKHLDSPAPKGAAWELGLHGCNTDPAGQFRAENGYISFADTTQDRADKSYWTSDNESKTAIVYGMAKGGPRQKWIITPVT
ncbi:hemopexin repeat-containing protein [Streptomyces olivoreticuli]|uniref:hemopexin repeat-containing protein n=1 Tax=Streptomyces olivoreticuli TaxID=68246 RepID=UPI000E271166|nr:hemopexin repeat-containing protein [Streptomyces olivoreticuli]